MTDRTLRRAAIAVAIVFAANGFLMASWASRIPQVRDRLDLDPAELGLVIMCVAVGAVAALPTSGLIVHRWGPTRVVAVAATVAAVAMAVTGIGVLVGLPVVAAGLVVAGFCIGVWDVAQNVEGATVDHRRAVPLMPRFHALFSLGTVAGALTGAVMNAVGVGVTAHLAAVGVICGGCCLVATRAFLPADDEPAAHTGRARLRRAWTERRTLLIGVFVLGVSFAEGAGVDWIAVAAVDGYATSAAVASLLYATFVAGVTTARWFGGRALARYGRVATLRTGVVLTAAGVLTVVFGGALPLFVLGAVLWGAGIALGFPVGMSAAADDESMAAPRVSVVATIGYTAFLAGPMFIGFAGDRSGVLHGLLLVPVVLLVAFGAAAATRPLAPSERVSDTAATG